MGFAANADRRLLEPAAGARGARALYIVGIESGVYATADLDLLKKFIDQAAEKKDGHGKPASAGREVNAGFVIAPANARESAGLLLEHEARGLALLNNQVWNCFHQAGILPPRAADVRPKGKEAVPEQGQEVVQTFLGFVPVSPDGSRYEYDARLREVVNRRHGSHRRPEPHGKLEPTSELGRLLAQIKALCAELRFHESGLHTVLTIERGH